MTQRKRTKKIFVDYNDYQDRPFGLKWGTAFALDELMKVVTKNQNHALRTVEELPIMDRFEIDKVLQIALLKQKVIQVQLNSRDEDGLLLPSVIGDFKGYADESNLYVGEYEIPWNQIRNVSLYE